MNTMREFVVFATITLSLGLSAAWAESKGQSDAERKRGDNFKVKWTKISYIKTVSLSDTEVSENQELDVSERMSLSCEIEILDPNLVLGISRSPVIVEMTDDKGGKIGIDTGPSNSVQMRYDALRFDNEGVHPTQPAKRKTAVRSALKLPPKESSYLRWILQIRPTLMEIDLNVGLGEKAPEKISRVKGYFYALIAQSYEYVDVPFKKSDKWVRLTPDVEVQITEARYRKDEPVQYALHEEGRPVGGYGRSIRSLSAKSNVPKRLVMEKQLIGPDGKPIHRHRGLFLPNVYNSSRTIGGQHMAEITKIRYVIAVNPAHYEIPFVLKNIQLPKP